MEWRISNIIIGIIIVGFFIAIISVNISNMNSAYGVSYDENLSSFNRMENMSLESKLAYDKVTNLSGDSNFFSQLDAYFTAGYGVLKVTANSVGTTNSLIDESIDKSNIGFSGQYLKMMLFTIIIIIIAIGIFLSAIMKWKL